MPTIKCITVNSTFLWNKGNTWYFTVEDEKLTNILMKSKKTGHEIQIDFSDFGTHFTLLFMLIGNPEEVTCQMGDFNELYNLIYKHPLSKQTMYHLELCNCNNGKCGSALGYTEKSVSTIGEVFKLVGFSIGWGPYFGHPTGVCLTISPLDDDILIKYRCRSDLSISMLEKRENAHVWYYSR
jgi:hypothetical protein